MNWTRSRALQTTVQHVNDMQPVEATHVDGDFAPKLRRTPHRTSGPIPETRAIAV
jgi:hypothetical protein